MAGKDSADDDPLGHLSEDERVLFFRFLTLIRENYKMADKAAFFLERRAGIINTCSITNLRDVLSHLATFLDPNTSADKKAAQVGSAEEHLRRAILEPYEIALATLTEKFEIVYENYKKVVLPIKSRHPDLADGPNDISIRAAIAQINELAFNAKKAKSRNVWDEEWERGVLGLPEAYDQLSCLKDQLQSFVNRAEQYRQERKLRRLAIWGIASTILLGVATIIIAVMIAK